MSAEVELLREYKELIILPDTVLTYRRVNGSVLSFRNILFYLKISFHLLTIVIVGMLSAELSLVSKLK